jgi:CheY-like chemotaxis protein
VPNKKALAKSILIVEDDVLNLEAYSSLLKNEGYQTIEVQNAQTAVEYLYRGILPDLILLDLKLPGRHGADLIAEMKLNPLFKNIPVIVASGFIGPAFDRSGVVAVFEKPVNNFELLKAISGKLTSSD